jgi:hypothetical protein
MSLFNRLSVIPERAFVFIFLGVFFVATLLAYFLNEDGRLLERQIDSKQRDLAGVLQLKDTYEMKKRASDKYAFKKGDTSRVSLGVVEDMVAKSFVGGTLTTLQPAATKEGKGNQQATVELKVTGAPLGEIVSFVKAAESAGLQIAKLRLSLPAGNPTGLDMQATVAERQPRG